MVSYACDAFVIHETGEMIHTMSVWLYCAHACKHMYEGIYDL